MKRKLLARILPPILLLTSVAVSSAALSAARIASDDIQRAELRLHDLGYYLSSIDGTNNSAMLSALYAFCDANNIPRQSDPPSALFERSSSFARSADADKNAVNPSVVVTGTPVVWADVVQLLTTGEAYTVVSCISGRSFQMRYTGGTGHAHMTPCSDEDANALLLLFSELHDFSKQPVTIELADVSVAASLQVIQHNDDAGDADTVYGLYCTDSVSDIGGLSDDDHAATVRIASGE